MIVRFCDTNIRQFSDICKSSPIFLLKIANHCTKILKLYSNYFVLPCSPHKNKEPSGNKSSGAPKVAATYSPTTCSTIGVAELGVGVCCCGAVWRGARPAQPLPQGVWGARRTISGRTVRQAWNVVGHGRHSYRGTHTWMAETDPYMGAGRTIHVSQARQQSASAGEAKDGTGGMAGTGRMAQLISGRVIHYYYACG